MMAAQLLATHNATRECYRRAMIAEQTLEGRREKLNQANKLSRTYATLIEALNRHRGKGQQKVTVEHVHVHAGGQAVVGMVETPGGGDRAKSEEQPHPKQIAHATQPAMRSPDKERRPPGLGARPRRRGHRVSLTSAVYCCICSRPVLSLRCEGSDAIGAKRTCRERRKRVDLTKMTRKRHGRLRISAVQIDDFLPFPRSKISVLMA